jgi:hypothetical protein
MPADPAVARSRARKAILTRHHGPDAPTTRAATDELEAAKATAYVRSWVRETRARQGLPEHVTDPATLQEFAAAVAETMARQGGDGDEAS